MTRNPRTLTRNEESSFQRDGYLLLRSVFPPEVLGMDCVGTRQRGERLLEGHPRLS